MRRLASALVGLALLGGTVLGTAAPSSAAASDCPNGYFCAWINSGFNAGRYQSPNFSASWSGLAINHNDSSWNNRFNAVRDVRVQDGSTLTICMLHAQHGQSQVGFNTGANDRGTNHVAPSSGHC